MGGIDWGEDGPTEEQAYVLLQRIFQAAERRHGRHESPGWLMPRPRSPLAADDRALHPWAASHTAVQAIVSGNDHLLALAHLVAGPAGILPAYGGFTLARAALEAGAIGLWAVGPDDPLERRINVLRWELKNKHDMVEFGGRMGRGDRDRVEDRQRATKRIYERASEMGIPSERLRERFTTTAMLTAAHIPVREPSAVAAWSAASAFAHGRSWPILLLQQTAWLPSELAGESRARVTADARVLAWFASTAAELLDHAERLTRDRGAVPKPGRGTMRIALANPPSPT